MQLPGFMTRIFATRAPALDKPTPAPPRGESARAVPSMVSALGGGFTAYNPDSLTTWAGADIYRKMLRDPQVKVAYHMLVAIVLGRGWRFEPGGDEASAERQAEIGDFLSFNLEHSLRGTFRQAMKEIMLAKAHGVSVSEKVFEAGDYQGRTMWLLRAVKGKPYQSFRFKMDPQGNLTGLVQEWQGKRIELDPRKFIIHVFYPELDPIWGESDLRAVYRPYWSKDVILKLWNIYLERMAGGFVVVKPEGGGAVLAGGERGDLEAILRNLSGGTGIILPDGFTMEMILSSSTDAFEKGVDFQDQQIIRGLFLPALLGFSPQMRVGGFSQAKEQFKAFFNVVTDQGDALADVLNEQLFRDLSWWNFGETRPPLFKFDDFTREQKLEIAKQWINAVNTEAVQGTLADENRLRELIDFDERDPEAEIITRPGASPDSQDGEGEPDTPPQRPGGTGGTPPEKPGRPPSRNAAKFAAGSTPSWRKRVNFKALGAALDSMEDRFAEALGLAVERAWEAVLAGLREITADGKDALDNVGERTIAMIGPDIRRGLQAAAAQGLRHGYGLGRSTAQEELNAAIGRAPAAMSARLRFAVELAPSRAVRCKRDDAEYTWAVAEFVEGVRLDTAEKYFNAKAFQISGNISEEIRKAVQAVLLRGIVEEKTVAEIVAELEPLLRDVIGERDAAGRRIDLGARLRTIVRTNLAEAFNQAQLAVYTDPDLGDFVRAFEYSAILDSRTTDFCRRYDGRILLKDDPEWSFITPPNHFNCRSRLIAVTAVDDFEPDGALPIEPAIGFGGKKAA